jgi:hypothetical protein
MKDVFHTKVFSQYERAFKTEDLVKENARERNIEVASKLALDFGGVVFGRRQNSALDFVC